MEPKSAKNNLNHPAVIITILVLMFIGGYLLFTKNSNNKLQSTPDSQQADIDALKKIVEDLKKNKTDLSPNSQPGQYLDSVDIQSIIKQWEPVTAYVDCLFNNPNALYREQSGSGMFYSSSDGSKYILTNRHVILDSDGFGADSCLIKFPGYDNNVVNVVNDGTGRQFVTPDDVTDKGLILIENPDSYVSSMKNVKFCRSSPSLGDSIAILGFPSIGSSSGVTVTQGIISGYDGDFFITDAKIEHGNSGGVAINLNGNCYLGLPTWAAAGQIESLARILKWQAIHQ